MWHRSMNQCPTTIELAREKRRVLVLWGHDRPMPFERAKVLGGGQSNQGSGARIGGVGHRIATQWLEEYDASVFHAPQLLGIDIGLRFEGGLRVDAPVGD